MHHRVVIVFYSVCKCPCVDLHLIRACVWKGFIMDSSYIVKLVGVLYSHVFLLIVTNWSLSGRVCSWNRPMVCMISCAGVILLLLVPAQ